MSILEVRDVSIRYLTGDFKEIGLKEYVLRKLKKNYHIKEFWADRHISFSLEKGDMLGIIGTNGAGKSTLLKVISGIMEPTEGYVVRKGTIAALLELGSGFDGELTVRENTYLRGAMLGYTRKFMDETYNHIISFAELEEFQDRPFKQLSSGMKSRLAFSIASLVRPDILILDEVLSVGDGAFKVKSHEKMKEILSSGATSILVSHSIAQVREMCNKVLWIHKGEQIDFGEDVNGICDRYEAFLNNDSSISNGLLDISKKTIKDRLKNEKTMIGKYPINYIFEEDRRSEFLVVVFSAFASTVSQIKKQYNFMNVCDDICCNRLFIQDSLGERGTYYMVENMDFSVTNQILEFIESARKKLNIPKENVITLGSSKGGSAALYFGLKGNYGHVISIAPQTRIGTYVDKIKDTAKYMFDLSDIDKSKEILDNIIYSLEEKNNKTLVHMYVSEFDELYPVHMKPFIAQMKKKRNKEKYDIVINNSIKCHNDHAQFNADYTINKLAEIIYGLKVDICKNVIYIKINNCKNTEKYDIILELEKNENIMQTIKLNKEETIFSLEDINKITLYIAYKNIIQYKRKVYSMIENSVNIELINKENKIFVNYVANEKFKDKMTYALYVNRPDGSRIQTFNYQKENVIEFKIEENISYCKLICFWRYGEERYSKVIKCEVYSQE